MTQSIQISRRTGSVQLRIDNKVKLTTSGAQNAEPPVEHDFAKAVAAALDNPLDYPPIHGGVVPGDVVAIVVDAELPEPGVAVTGVLRALSSCEPSRIDVIVSQAATPETQAGLRAALPDGVELTVHCGVTREELRYLAANDAAEPIYLNRLLVDADLVVPITVARHRDPLVFGSSFGGVFPDFADHDAQVRTRLHESDIDRQSSDPPRIPTDDAIQVDWLLGLQWLVTVELTPDGRPGDVVAGTPAGLARRAQEREASMDVAPAADVVVATLEGNDGQQSIANLLRSALVARGYAAVDASIVLVCDLDDLGIVNEHAEWFADVQDDENDGDEAPGKPIAESATDHARRLLSILINEVDSGQRYLLMSNCPAEAVEAFGFGVVQDAAALSRLINARASCAVLRAAQFASVPTEASTFGLRQL